MKYNYSSQYHYVIRSFIRSFVRSFGGGVGGQSVDSGDVEGEGIGLV
jgi:hypothetical protein